MTTELESALQDAHNARVEARLIRAGMADAMLPHCVRLLEGGLDLDATAEAIDVQIAAWRIHCPQVFRLEQPAPATARPPGAAFGAGGAAEAAKRFPPGAAAPVPAAPPGDARGRAGAAEASRRFGGQ